LQPAPAGPVVVPGPPAKQNHCVVAMLPDLGPPRDGEYSQWERDLTARYPPTLAEMRSPSVPLGRPDTEPLARWGVEIHAGWRPLVERLLDRGGR
jgi:hypothetical protein